MGRAQITAESDGNQAPPYQYLSPQRLPAAAELTAADFHAADTWPYGSSEAPADELMDSVMKEPGYQGQAAASSSGQAALPRHPKFRIFPQVPLGWEPPLLQLKCIYCVFLLRTGM